MKNKTTHVGGQITKSGAVRRMLALGLAMVLGAASAHAQAPVFTTQPANSTVAAGGNATFGPVAATGATSFQWQQSSNGGVVFSNITAGASFSGNNTTTLTAIATNSTENGLLLRCLAINATGTTASTNATLTVNFIPTFSTQPTNSTVAVGANATFTVATTGNPAPTLQWQVSTNGGTTFANITNGASYAGTTTTTLTVIAANSTENASLFRALAINTIGTTNSSNATLTVPPTFSTQPSNTTVTQGSGNGTFTVAVTGTPAPTLQWQVSTNGGTTFTNITNGAGFSGNNTTVLTVIAPLVSQSGNLFRALGINSGGTTNSTNATLTVVVTPSITTQPALQSVTAGTNATFTTAASGTPAPTLQWQLSTDGGTTWSNITNGANYSGNTGTTLTVSNTTTALSGGLYRVQATNSAGVSNSTATTLTVNAAPSFVVQPLSRSRVAGSNTTFNASATGGPAPTLQWQVSTDGGTTFSNTTDGAVYTGSTTTALVIGNVTQSLSGNVYRLFAFNFVGSANSSVATLTVSTTPSITTQPVNTTVTAGNTANISVVASGTPNPTYQWQVSTDGGFSFGNLSNSANVTGATTANLSIANTTAAQNGYEFQCVVTNTGGAVVTNVAILTVNYAPSFTTQPASAAVIPGANATFTVATSANPAATYQWLVSTDSGATFNNVINTGNITGNTSATLSLTAVPANANGDIFQCVATNSVNSTTSSNATLAVTTPPTITTQPVAMLTANGLTTVTLKVVATGSSPLYFQWYQNGVALVGQQSPVLAFFNANATNSGNFTVVVTNAGGNVTSSVSNLTVAMTPLITMVQPLTLSVKRGSSAQILVTANGVQPLQYQWFKNGKIRLVNNGRVSGAKSQLLSIARVNNADIGTYSVTITNADGTTTSVSVPLAVN